MDLSIMAIHRTIDCIKNKWKRRIGITHKLIYFGIKIYWRWIELYFSKTIVCGDI